jgi:hypothetical protein
LKNLITTIFIFISFSFSVTSCNQEEKPTTNQTNGNTTNPIGSKMKVTIGSVVFTVTLNENETATAFKTMLPLSINMVELNGNEKYHNLAENIPTNSSNPETIQNGDLMLYGSNTLVLFYKTFSTSYGYTKLGSIDDTTGLASALGTGNVTVSFEMQ